MTADQKQVELMRAAGPQRRAAMALRLSDETIALARRAIARRHPELDEVHRHIEFLRVQYGPDLAAKFERWITSRKP